MGGTNCETLVDNIAHPCDADMAFTEYVTSSADALVSRTKAVGAGFGSLPNMFLEGCGSSVSPDYGISRGTAISKCAARDDCFAIDYYANQRGGSAYYCVENALET